MAPLRRQHDAVERVGAGRHRGHARRRGHPRPQRQDALHRSAARGVQRQGAPARHGRRRHRSRGALPDRDARPAGRRRRGLRPRAVPRLQRLGVGSHAGGRRPALRRGRGTPDERCRRCGRGGGRDPARRVEARHRVGVPAPEPVGRLAAVQRRGLRPGVGGGGRHRDRARVPSVPDARSPRRVPRPGARPPDGCRRPVRADE